MRITILGSGTSQGIPVIGCRCDVCCSDDPRDKRLRSSVRVEYNGLSFVIDASADFRQQMLREDVSQMDFLLVTHAHKDHIGGLDDIRSFNHINQKPMDIYADQRTCDAISAEFHYAFNFNPYPGVPQLNLIVVNDQPFTVRGVDVIPIRVMHHQLPILGFRIADFAYITDANYISDEELNKLQGLELLVVNALRIATHYSHFNLTQAIETSQRLHCKRTVFTHIGHQMGLYAHVNSDLPERMELAFDQMKIEIK